MFDRPLVSIIVPIYNMERYLGECIASLAGQTYGELEILLMDDGSTDRSPRICEEWCRRDRRMSLHRKQNSGYGDTMNRGIDLARGKYIMFIESDDFVEPGMAGELVSLAEEHGTDFVKSDYYRNWYGVKEKNNNFGRCGCVCGQVFSARENMRKFTTDATVWSALYRREFLDRSGIRFRATPGASYQDIGFIFKVFAVAERGYFTPEAYVNYRQDNGEASGKSREKVMAVAGEFRSCEEFLDSRNLDGVFYKWLMRSRFNAYRWNLSRIAPQFVDGFVSVFSSEIRRDMEAGRYLEGEYDPGEQIYMHRLAFSPAQLAREIKEEKFRNEHARLYEALVFDKVKRAAVTYIYGAGKLGQEIHRYLESNVPGCSLRFVCTEGEKEKGIYGIDDVPAGDELVIIAIASLGERTKVFGELQKRGFTGILPWDAFYCRIIRKQ